MGESLDIMIEESKRRRKERSAQIPAKIQHARDILNRAGIPFTEHNGGTHFVVENPKGRAIDLWPTTGKWRVRDGSSTRHGVKYLAQLIEGAF